MKILVVSALQKESTGLRPILEQAFSECEILELHDPLLVVKQNQNFDADLVICQFGLYIIDGIQLIKLLRKQREDTIPVLLEPSELHLQDAQRLGIYHFHIQPTIADFQQLWQENQLLLSQAL